LEISRKKNGVNVHFKGVEEEYHFTVSTKEVGGDSKMENLEMGILDTLFLEKVEFGNDEKVIRTSVIDKSGGKSSENEFVLHSALGAEIEMLTNPHSKYNNNGSLNLVDGIKGSLPWKGSQWLGFDTSYVEFIVDLGSKQNISSINLGFLDQKGSWIYLPESVSIQIAKKSKWCSEKTFNKDIESSDCTIPVNKKGRYVRVRIRAMDVIPEGQEGGGNTPWTFIDEIQIK
jgi:hypothetical protein